MVSKKFLNVALFAAAVSAMSFAGQAQAAILDLTSGGSVSLAALLGPDKDFTGIKVGDKVFSGFRYDAHNVDAAASKVTIYGIHKPDVNQEGLQFLGNWSAEANGVTEDTGLTYEVTVTPDSKFVISDFHINSNASVTPRSGSGTVNITDSFYYDSLLTEPVALDNRFGTIVSSAGKGLGLSDLSDTPTSPVMGSRAFGSTRTSLSTLGTALRPSL